jgi:hypothetical protein
MACLQGDRIHQSGAASPLPKYSFVSTEIFEGLESSALDNSTSALLSSIPAELAVACLSRTKLAEISHQLLRLILFPTTEDRFFSLTSYGGEVSLILQRSELEGFGDHRTLLMNSNTWEALHVQPGPSGVSTLTDLPHSRFQGTYIQCSWNWCGHIRLVGSR